MKFAQFEDVHGPKAEIVIVMTVEEAKAVVKATEIGLASMKGRGKAKSIVKEFVEEVPCY